MRAITSDPDTGVVDQDCRPLNAESVYAELSFHIHHGLSFLGQPPHYWRKLIADHAQEIADEADPEEYDFWGVKYMEQA